MLLTRSFSLRFHRMQINRASDISASFLRDSARLHAADGHNQATRGYIARQALAEDNLTGRLREDRFNSRVLLDEAKVTAAMAAAVAYVDVNPICTGTAETPEESDYTSIQLRVLEQDPKIAVNPAYSPPDRREAVPGPVDTAFFATERTGGVLACPVRMRDRAKSRRRGAWGRRSRSGGE